MILSHPETTGCSLHHALGLGSYRTAWRMARIIREALRAVDWPLLNGEVVLCDVNLAPGKPRSKSIWLAIERRSSGTRLMRGWRRRNSLPADFRTIAESLQPGTTVITPPSCEFRILKQLGFKHRSEPVGDADAFPVVNSAAAAFRRMLQNRRHHSLSAATIECYLGEFIFRTNAAVLKWDGTEQKQQVLALLFASR